MPITSEQLMASGALRIAYRNGIFGSTYYPPSALPILTPTAEELAKISRALAELDRVFATQVGGELAIKLVSRHADAADGHALVLDIATPNTFDASASGLVRFDFDGFDRQPKVGPDAQGYIGSDGQFRIENLLATLAHELVHAINKPDTNSDGTFSANIKGVAPSMVMPEADFFGYAVPVENRFWRETVGSTSDTFDYRLGYGFRPQTSGAFDLLREGRTSLLLNGSNFDIGFGGNAAFVGRYGIDLDFRKAPDYTSALLIGTGAADTLVGGRFADHAYGGNGDDRLVGWAGDDLLFGGRGNDALIGGEGHDFIDGGVDADAVRFAIDFAARLNELNVRVTITAQTGVVIDGRAELPSWLPSTYDKERAIVATNDGNNGVDILFNVERIYLPGTSGEPSYANSIIKTGANDWGGVSFYDSAGTDLTDKIQLLRGTGPTQQQRGDATQFWYDLATDVRTAQLDIEIDASTDAATRVNNAIFINERQLLGGARFLLNSGEFNRLREFQTDLQFERRDTYTQAQLNVIAARETARLREALGSEPAGAFEQQVWRTAYNGIPTRVETAINQEYFSSGSSTVIIGQQGEQYVFGTARPDGTRSLDIYFGRNGQHLTAEIDNWRDGDLGITIPTARAYNTFTSGNGLSDRIEDVPQDLIQAVLREQGLITEITPPDGTTPDPDAPPTDPNLQRRGSGGDDLIAGMGGNDTLTGGAGRDTLRGNDGDDTYTFASGDGIDLIEDAAGQNTIQFRNPANTAGTAITLASVVAQRLVGAGGTIDLQLTYGGTNTILIRGFFDNPDALGWGFGDSTGVSVGARRFLLEHGITLADFTEAAGNVAPTLGLAETAFSGLEGRLIAGQLSTSADANGDAVVYEIVAGSVQHGSVALDAVSGRFIFTPTAGFVGAGSFAYTANDGFQTSGPRVVNIDLTNANDAPVSSDWIRPPAPIVNGQAVAFTVPAATFSDADGDVLTYTATLQDGSALPPWLVFNAATRTFTGTVPALVTDTNLRIAVRATDPSGASAAEYFQWTVEQNAAPVLSNVVETAATPNNVVLTGQLAAATDADGDQLRYVLVPNSAVGGTVVINANGSYQFTATAGFTGAASFTYTVTDGLSTTIGKAVAITVRAANVAPTASDDAGFVAVEGQPLLISQAALLANDSDANVGNILRIIQVEGAVNGSVSIDGAGNVIFTSAIGSTGPASFTYRISDGFGGVATARVDLTVQAAPNAAPDAVNDSLSIARNTTTLINPNVLLANDSDANRDSLTLVSVQGATRGTVSLDGNGQIVFTPEAGYTGAASFTYTVTDGRGFTDTATVNIAVIVVSTLVGTAGNDTLTGSAAQDSLDGGAGTDILLGRGGDDTYVFGRSYGIDTINEDGDNSTASRDKVILSGLNQNEVTFAREGNSLAIRIVGTADKLLVADQFFAPATLGTLWDRIEEFVFANGSVLTAAQVDLLVQQGNGADQILQGYTGQDTLDGGSGNDFMYGFQGDDTYVFGRGYGIDTINEDGDNSTASRDKVILSGLNQNEVTFAREGNSLAIRINGTVDKLLVADQFFAPATLGTLWDRIEEFVFADGSILTAAQVDALVQQGNSTSQILQGYIGTDTLNGGGGNDILIGYAGDDTYVFGRGNGVDTINEEGNDSASSLDRVILSGLNQDDVTFSRTGMRLVIAISGTADALQIDDQFFAPTTLGSLRDRIEEFVFADGSVLTASQIDVIVQQGNSTNQSLYGYFGADTLNGAGGTDTLVGYTGDDTYVFGRGFGNDLINDEGDNSITSRDKVVLSGLTRGDVTFRRNDTWLEITIKDTGEKLSVADQFYAPTVLGTLLDRIEEFIFADGTTLTAAQIDVIVLQGTATAETLYGYHGNDTLDGLAGNDTLIGYAGNDHLTGGQGNDFLFGFTGNDTYVFGRGDGVDLINDEGDNTLASADAIRLTGAALGDLEFIKSGRNLIIKITGTTDQITIVDQFFAIETGGSRLDRIERFVLDDGTELSAENVDRLSGIGGIGQNLVGDGAANILAGTVGNDVITGNGGADILIGTGGSDLYVYTSGDGSDSIRESDGSLTAVDTLRLTNVASANVTLLRQGTDLVVELLGTGERITVASQFLSTAANLGIERIEFSDTSWTLADIRTRSVTRGTTGVDTLTGTDGNDVFQGLAGNDTIRSAQGNDTFVFASGDGSDVIDETSASTLEIDTLRFTDLNISDVTFSRRLGGDDLLVSVNATGETVEVDQHFYSTTANYGVERVTFANGQSIGLDQINAAAWYRGTSAAETISGSSFADTLHGNLGNDTLSGGTNGDTYIFTRGDGSDVINDSSASAVQVDTLNFTDINQSDVVFRRVGIDLWIDVIGTSDSIRLQNQYLSTTDRYGIERIIFADGTTRNLAVSNEAPQVVAPLQAQTSLEDAPWTFAVPAGTFSDPDGNLLTYTAGLAGGAPLPSWLSFNADNGTFSGTPPANFNGSLSIAVVASDGQSAAASSFSLTIEAVNDAPAVQIALANQTALEDTPWSFVVPSAIFADVDGDALLLTASLVGGAPLPSWLVFDSGTRAFTGTPPANFTGNLDLAVTAADSSSSATSVFTLRIDPENDSPFVQVPIGTQASPEDASWSFTIPAGTFADPDGDSLTLAATLVGGSPLPIWLDFDAGSRTFSGIPPNDFNGSIGVRVTASDGTATVSTGFTLSITALNDNPLAVADAGYTVVSGGFLSIPMAALLANDTDLDNDALTIVSVANALNGTVSIVGQTVQFSGAPGYVGPASFTYVVSDGQGGTAEAAVSVTVGYNVINGTSAANALAGTFSADQISGLGGNDTINAGSGNDSVDGGSGSDLMSGGLGDDVYIVDSASDAVIELADEGVDRVRASVAHALSANVEHLELLGSGNINGTGNDLSNTITGNAGNNTLSGLIGNDTLAGGAGNDTYVVDSAGDVVTEMVGAGTDVVQAAVSYTLGSHLENLTLTGSATFNGTGNALNNTIIGNSAGNVLDGGLGSDTLIGGLGNDVYIVDDAGDLVTETSSGGFDTVLASVTYTAAINVEALTLTGATDVNGTGNNSANVLTGNSGANSLNGLVGADTLIGGAGNDIYVVDNVGDRVIEAAGEGIDTIQSSITQVLAANVENLALTGTGNAAGTGNAGDNLIVGNAGNNTLSGAGGADTLIGGAGNDTYVVDSVSDTATELSAQGIDTVQSSIGWVLSTNIERLTLTGLASINATGNDLANTLTGNAGNNLLDGGIGADSMAGSLGDDTYIVDNSADVVTEAAAAGTDTVLASANFTLGSNIETLTLTGAAIAGVGNATANTIYGNASNNTLNGAGGNDTLIGGDGDDTLIGGTGSDSMSGGQGNDVYIVDSVGDAAIEFLDQGFDAVQSSVSFALSASIETLALTGTANINGTGNAFDNVVVGNGGANVIVGAAGNDTLTGGLGNDTFTFAPGSGTDRITDFTAGAGATDSLRILMGTLFDSYSEIMAVTAQAGDDTVITIDANTMIVLEDVARATLVADDFRFV